MTGRDRDLTALRRNTVLWTFAVLWILASYLVQDPPRDPYEAAQRTAFGYAMLIVIPLVTAVVVLAWAAVLRRRV